MEKLTRRNFVAGAAATAIAAGAASAIAAPVYDDGQWDAEYDVVVVGLGGAGANAAVAAESEGVKVLAIEKAPEDDVDPNTKASGQFVMATDNAEGLYIYLSQLMGKFENWDPETLMAYCEGCAENFDWMCGPMGGDPMIVCNPDTLVGMEQFMKSSWHIVENAWGLGRSGYVYTWNEFPEIPESQYCKCLTATGTRFDAGYYNLCMAALEAHKGENLDVWYNCPGKSLVLNAEGEVTGIVVVKDGVEMKIKANGGVCLCTGGIEANQDMICDYTQTPYVYLQAGKYNTGDGVKMAQQAGAYLWHMSNVSGWLWSFQPEGDPHCKTVSSMTNGIMVGPSGARFMKEGAAQRHGRIDVGGRWIITPMPAPVYIIVDSNKIENKLVSSFSDGNADEIASGVVISGETIEELSAAIREIGDAPSFNLNGELDIALEKYNKHCHANDGEGEEDDWGRMCTVPVEVGPFYALKIGPTMYNTQCGPRRNGFAQVIDIAGMPIQGLFEGGELGSIFADMYNGSGNLGETMVFGRFAGKNAALRAKGEFVGATEPAMTYHEMKVAGLA